MVEVVEFKSGVWGWAGGNVGGEPEMQFTPSGKPITNFSLGCGGSEKEEATWVRCTVWESLAERANEFLKKGMRVMAHGQVKTRKVGERTFVNMKVVELWASPEKGQPLQFVGEDRKDGGKGDAAGSPASEPPGSSGPKGGKAREKVAA